MRRPRKNTALLSLLIALILLPFILPYLDVFPLRGEKIDPEKLMVEAVYHANESATRLLAVPEDQDALAGLKRLASEAAEIEAALKQYAQTLPESRLGQTLKNAALTYAAMARAANHTYTATSPLAQGLEGAREALLLLQECKIDEALEKYRGSKPQLATAKAGIEKALEALSEGDPRNLLSGNHTEVYMELGKTLTKTLIMLKELDRLFSLTEANLDALRTVCRGGNLTEPQMQGLGQMLGMLNPSNAGKYAYEEAQFLSMIRQALIPGMTQNPGQGGSGAGYGAPPSDD